MILPELMRCDYVAQRRTLIKHVIPCERKVTSRTLRSILQSKVGYHPRSKLKFANMSRWVVAIWSNHVSSCELRRCKDYRIGGELAGGSSVAIQCNDLDIRSSFVFDWNDLKSCAIQLDLRLDLVEQVINETSVALWPGDERLRINVGFGYARTEVKQPRPGAGLIECHPIVIAAGIIHPPTKTRTRETLTFHPPAHGHAVQRSDFLIVRARRDRDCESASILRVVPRNPACHLS